MSLPETPLRQPRFWLALIVVFVLLLWVFGPVLMPFAVGLALAYFLAPIVTVLERHKCPRWLGALAVMVAFGIVVGGVGMLVLPTITNELGALINAAPIYIDKLRGTYLPWFENWLTRFHPDDVQRLRNAAGESAGEAAGWLAGVVKHIVSSGFAVIDTIALAVITPVTAFFTLRDWPKLTGIIDSMFPRRAYDTILGLLRDIDHALSGFVRGQALVCLALATYYGVGLSLAGVQYGLAIGLTGGLLSFIPFVGTLLVWSVSFVLALVQFNADAARMGYVVVVLVIGHILESYILTPRLIGQRVGLHPLWILFALIAGAKLAGFVGVLIAVPTAAIIGVLVRFSVRQYKASRYYSA
jgi:hypothetical protein